MTIGKIKMAEAKVKTLLRMYRAKDRFDAVILAVHACLAEKGFCCVGSGENTSPELQCNFGEGLPPDWNQLDDVCALQYRKANMGPVYLFKALRLGGKMAVYLMEEDESKMYDTTLDINQYINAGTECSSQGEQTGNLDSLFRQLDQLKGKLCNDILDKFSPNASTTADSQKQEHNTRETSERRRAGPSRLIEDDPLRLPPRRPPDFRNEWIPPAEPFGYGDADRFPGHPGAGGMVLDPFHSGGGIHGPGLGIGPTAGQLPRGSVPPGARFDPFGPVPPGGNRADSRSGRFSGPDSDHLPPPGYDDMFM